MKKINLIGAFLLFGASAVNLHAPSAPFIEYKEKIADVVEVESEWDTFIRALVFVESSGNTLAVGTKDDYGVLQITPIYVAEANRIVGYERYVHESCFDSLYSIEIFNVVNGRHNPERCFDVAIRLHNPNAGAWYKERILNKYNELKNENNL